MEGRFNLRKWRTNDEELRELICDNDTSIKPSKILGVQWDEQHDVFIYDLKDIFDQAKDLSPTKRNILKTLASFFDHLGHLQPIVLHYKLLFQKLYKMKLNWDTEIPSDFIKEWNDLLKILND